MYALALTNKGFTVTAVASASDALTWIEGQHFDVILLDMLLGGMSGIDFLEAAQLQVKSPETKVVGLSNIGSDSVKARGTVLGLVDFLDKADYDPARLAEYLNRLLGTAPPSEGLPTA
jgi:CheY-like chemotaxis protein